MLKMWGRKTSSNVQKAMWAVGELKLAHERIDVGGAFGKNKEAPYLAMNPNGLVPTLEEEDGFILWESNSVVRYLAAKHDRDGVLEPKDLKARALAQQWMDWQLSVCGPALTPAFWGLIRTPPEKRDHEAIKASQAKSTDAMKILDARLAKAKYTAGDAFSYGDIPVGIMVYRYWQLVPERPEFPNLKRWYDAISARQAFKDHVSAVPLT
ncbi:MAG TPA: glutathione S-transferase family protein [Bradyrhizobium sp.]|nr:glutathione S-transferase family protein [Bradyrhizobium sp.]